MEKIDFKNVKGTDYSKINEFKRHSDLYTKIAENEEFVVWKMERVDRELPYLQFEVWKKLWKKNPDGSVYMKAPSDEEFGRYGWFICGKPDHCKTRVFARSGISIL